MNISDVLGAVVRRWYVTLTILGLTAYGASQLWERAVPEYSTSSVVSVVASPTLLLARQSEDPAVVISNPYSDAPGTLTSLLADSVVNGNVDLPAGAEGARITTTSNPARAESFFTVQTTAPTPDASLSAVVAVEGQAPLLLADIQQRAGAAPDQLYTTLLTRPATEPVESYPDRARLVVGVVLAGLLLAALLCAFVDGIIRAARQRAHREDEADRALVIEEIRSADRSAPSNDEFAR